jgi:N utilization substance protein B
MQLENRRKQTMSRRASRELAMKLMYQLDLQKEDREEQIADALSDLESEGKEAEYVSSVLNGAFEIQEQIDAIIEKYSKRWKINRISKVDLAILRVAIYEIMKIDDIPVSVSINEAVELAKKYGNDESGSYVNGILGRIAAEIAPEGK